MGKSFDRRAFITSAGGALVGVLATPLLTGLLEGFGAVNESRAAGKRVAERFAEKIDDIKPSEFFEKYFLPLKTFHIAVATEGVPTGKITYSNEAHAIRSINTAIGGSKIIRAEGYNIMQNKEDSYIALGGSGTNMITRGLLGHPDDPQFRYINGKVENVLNYSIAKLPTENRAIRMQDGEIKKSFRYAIIDKDKRIIAAPEYGKDGQIKSDYLIVTRINLYPDAGELISFAGLHGPSIRGIAHLINNLSTKDKELIREKLGSSFSSFQIIFRMDQITPLEDKNENNTVTSTPREVVLHENNIVRITPKII
jgi:hypothetical protein